MGNIERELREELSLAQQEYETVLLELRDATANEAACGRELADAHCQLRGAVAERDHYKAALERMAVRNPPDGLAEHALATVHQARPGGQ